MSIRPAFTIIPATTYDGRRAGLEVPGPDAADSVWIPNHVWTFHEAVRGESGPIRFLIQGEETEESFDRLADEDYEGDGCYFGTNSPETVQAIAAALRTKYHRGWMVGRIREFAPHFVRHKTERDRVYEAFDEVVRIYTLAAARGAAVQYGQC